MDVRTDYYATLGVLPGAEDFVIRAAYKALAQRYHPDRPISDSDSHKMAAINEAYRILSDVEQRRKYDASRRASTNNSSDRRERPSEDTKSSASVDQDWSIAIRFYPGLLKLQERLERISPKLSSAFRTRVVDGKAFDQGEGITFSMEEKYLAQEFGPDRSLMQFASLVFQKGLKDIAQELKETVRVLNGSIPAEEIINAVKRRHPSKFVH